MNQIYKIVAGVIGTLIALVSVFFGGVRSGKNKKEAEIFKKGVDDALETKKREDVRRTDSIDDVVKRMRDYTN